MPALKSWYAALLYLILAVLACAGAVFCVIALKSVSVPSESSAGIQLEIRSADSGKVYRRWPLDSDGEFAIEFIHSVNMSPVREIFTVEGDMIRPRAVRFNSFGAGMQSDLEPGMTMSRDGDALVISGFTRAFGELRYIVGTVSDHLLLINGGTYSLRELCGRNARIVIRVRR
jgi:hypothetical protein